MFDRMRELQEEHISGGGDYVEFVFLGEWFARLDGIFNLEDLKRIESVIKSPTSRSIPKRSKQKGLFDG